MELEELIRTDSDAMIRDLKKLITIKSVGKKGEGGYPFGTGVQRCLEECLDLAEKMGFKTANIDNMLGYCEYGSGNEMTAVLGHLDVVPEGEGWTYPPYRGEEENGRIYGRGAIDDKGPVIAAMYALKAVREAEIPLKRRVRIFFGLNEETGSADMKYYLSHGGEVPVMGFTPDGEFPLINGEKGIVNAVYEKRISRKEPPSSKGIRILEIHGGTAVNVVPALASAVLEEDGETVKVREEGTGAHASVPYKGVNAAGKLLVRLDGLETAGKLHDTIHFLAERFGTEWDGQSAGVKCSDAVSGALTLNLGTIAYDGETLRVGFSMRYPVTLDFGTCGQKLEELMHGAGFATAELVHKRSLYMEEDSPLVKILSSVYEEVTGESGKPKCIGGGTYAKMMPNILAFGPVFPGDAVCEHEPDEYVEREKLIRACTIMAHAISRMAGEGEKTTT